MDSVEAENSGNILDTFAEDIAQLLDNMSVIGNAINKKALKLLCQIGGFNNTDLNNLENVGAELVKLLYKLSINMVDITNSLQNNIERLNDIHEEKPFTNLYYEVMKYKKSFIVDNSDTSSEPVTQNKHAQTDVAPNNLPDNDSDSTVQCDNHEVKTEVETKVNTNLPNDINLSLIRTNTQDTDDGWIDSINRKPSDIELWHKEREGKKVFVTDEPVDLNQDDDDDDEWDKETQDFNFELEKRLENTEKDFLETIKDETFVIQENNLSDQKDRRSQLTNTTDKKILHGTLKCAEVLSDISVCTENKEVNNSRDVEDTNGEYYKTNTGEIEKKKVDLLSRIKLPETTENNNLSRTDEVLQLSRETSSDLGNTERLNNKDKSLQSISSSPVLDHSYNVANQESIEKSDDIESNNNNKMNSNRTELCDANSDKYPSKKKDDLNLSSKSRDTNNIDEESICITDKMSSKDKSLAENVSKNCGESPEQLSEYSKSDECNKDKNLPKVNEQNSSNDVITVSQNCMEGNDPLEISLEIKDVDRTSAIIKETNIESGDTTSTTTNTVGSCIIEVSTDMAEQNSLSSNESFVFNIDNIFREDVDILSDPDSDVQLDVSMEEIVSNGLPSNGLNNWIGEKKQDRKFSCVSENINTNEKIAKEESCPEKLNTSSSVHTVGDELLELLREVQIPSVSPLVKHMTSNEDVCIVEEANKIFKILQEETGSDISDSDNSDNELSSYDSDLLEENFPKLKHISEKYQSNKSESLPIIRKCYVSLKRLNIPLEPYQVCPPSKKLDSSINRLCDISNIMNKRRSDSQLEAINLKKYKLTENSKKGSSVSQSYESSDSDSDTETYTPPTFPPDIISAPLEQQLDDLLAKAICNGYKSSSDSETTDINSDSENKAQKKVKTEKNETTIQNKKTLKAEDRKQKAWKNDPLLRGKLTSDDSSSSSSDSEYEASSNKRVCLKPKHTQDKILSTTEDNNSSSDSETAPCQAKKSSPSRKYITLSDVTDTDSDIEIIVPKQIKLEENSSMEENQLPSGSQKGRRNIRALMSEEKLAEATVRAHKEEQERIERLEGRYKVKESLSQSLSQSFEEEGLILDVDEDTGKPLVKVHQTLYKRLKPHQRSGIQFMWDSCYESLKRLNIDEGSGCILAHCMGLGKTFQVITLIHTLFSCEQTNTKHVLVVCPLSTVSNWKKEVKLAFKDFEDTSFDVITIGERKEISQKFDMIRKWYLKKKSVLVMGYEAFENLTNGTKLGKMDSNLNKVVLEALIDPGPDLVVCDEGHLLRNKKALKTQALTKIKTKRRVVLTGTPLQNNLLEYYYMVNFVKPNLLGNLKEFKTNFVNPITNGQYEDSTAEDIKLMMKRTHVLHKLLKKSIQRVEDTELKKYLPKIVDHAVFVQLHPVQVELYKKFSQITEKNNAYTNKKGFLSDFSMFQYICTHPYLLQIIEKLRNKKIKERDLITNEQEDNPICNIDGWWKAIVPQDASERIQYGNKLMVLKSIIEECEEIGDKVLVFSQSLGELDLIEHFLKKEGTAKCASWQHKNDYYRMDGTVPPSHRSTICDLFNDKDNKELRLLLMSTKVGGLGLNLTAANRVVIMTVNWNPSYDIQSVFRVYRFGQEKEVYVYRLIALDSMEEKVYQRTVTKLAIAHRVVDKHSITRHYKSVDLQELYSCKPSSDIERPVCNVPDDKVLAKLILKLPYIFKYHEHQALLINRPEDNLNEQELNAAWDEFKRIKDTPRKYPTPNLVALPNGPTFSMAYNLIKPTGSGIQNVPRPNENFTNEFHQKTNITLSEQNGLTGLKENVTNKIVEEKNPPWRLLNVLTDKLNTAKYKPVLLPDNSSKFPVAKKDNRTENQDKDSRSVVILSHNLSELNNRSTNNRKTKVLNVINPASVKRKLNENLNGYRIIKRASRPGNVPIVLHDVCESVHNLSNTVNKMDQHIIANGSDMSRNQLKKPVSNDVNSQGMTKASRQSLNNITSAPITVDDDDDDDSIVFESVSDTGSLSDELITNLEKGGVTVSKITDSKNNNVISVD